MANKKLTTLFTLFVFSAFATHAWSSDYQDGLTAYIDGNYSLAQKHWLSGAKKKDAKSMFNLGLLHEQAKVTDANIEKAMNWFSLANDNGYPAAAYHMAQRMLDRGGSDDEAFALINSSAAKGYAPAQRYLGQPAPVKAAASDARSQLTQSQKGLGSVTSGNLAWISRQPSKGWTIQLLAFTDKNKVDNFVNEHSLIGKAHYYSETVDGEVFYKLVYGTFTSKDKAEFARQNLSAGLTQYGPWLRQWASVHKALK